VFSQVYLSEDLSPVVWFLLPLKNFDRVGGVMATQIDLMEMWGWVASTRVGKQGFVSVVEGDGTLVATGDPQLKRAILSSDQAVKMPGVVPGKMVELVHLEDTPSGSRLISVSPIGGKPSWFIVITQPTSEAFAPIKTMTIEFLVMIVLVLLIMVIAAIVGSRKTLLNPVRELFLATQALGKGDLNYRIPFLSNDELGQLGKSFNSMIENLAELQDRAKKQERLVMFGRIAGGLAHDLKHPVKNIENAAKLMESLYEDPEYRETFTRIVQREFERINQFLDDLRNLTHEMPFRPFPFNLHRMLSEILESFKMEAEKKKIRFTLEDSQVGAEVIGDSGLLRRVFENLISNAIQAMTLPGGEIQVRLEKTGGKISAMVVDTGPGIDPEKVPGLFEEFMTTKGKGLGLGLAIARKIMELHHGAIGVESRLGEGTRFNLSWSELG